MKVSIPKSFNLQHLLNLTPQALNACKQNIRMARSELVAHLHNHFPPREDQLLYEWQVDGSRYAMGRRIEASNFELDNNNRRMILSTSASFILRHIMYSHNLPLPNVLTLWSCFYVLIMRQPIELDMFVSQTALWNNIYQLHYLDRAFSTKTFKPFISKRTVHGFRRYYFSSSDDSEHHNRNRHVLIISNNTSDEVLNPQPSYRHVTSSVNNVKSSNASKNAEAIIGMLGVWHAAYYGVARMIRRVMLRRRFSQRLRTL